jgi:hypothetical protein
MAESSELQDLIRAAAQGATGGVAALREVGIGAGLEDFTVEVQLNGDPGSPQVAASVVLSFVVPAATPGSPSS